MDGRAFLVIRPLPEDICPIDAAAMTSSFKTLSMSSASFFSSVMVFSRVEFFLARRAFCEGEAVAEETFSFVLTAGILSFKMYSISSASFFSSVMSLSLEDDVLIGFFLV